MQQTERISAWLRDASSLPETLDVSFDAFEVIRLLARRSQDRDPGFFAMFMRTADAAVDGREAITVAPSLPLPSRGAAEVDALAEHPDLAKVTASVASLAALLDGLLTHAATAATTPGDRAACEQAASAARRIHQLMVRSDDNPRLDAVAQAELVRRGEVTAAELVGWAIERIEDLNPTLNALITPTYDQALAAAAAMTPPTGPLAGVPYLVKDLIGEVAGVPFSEGSRFLRGHVSHFDSELVLRLRRAGLINVGKTNTPEFGMAPTCEPVLHGPTRNPWDTTRSTSGSSGGSAAAVAARMVPMAHANDLGGSIRYPASACGLFGLKPTIARNPLGPEYGDAVSGWACEHALTRTVRDSAVLLDATAGPAPGDPYGPSAPVRPFADEVGRDPGRLRIGYTAVTPEGRPAHPDCVAALDDAVALCASLGHELVEAGLPGLTPQIGAAIGSIFGAATAWVIRYWIRRLGRQPADDELEPLTRAYPPCRPRPR